MLDAEQWQCFCLTEISTGPPLQDVRTDPRVSHECNTYETSDAHVSRLLLTAALTDCIR